MKYDFNSTSKLKVPALKALSSAVTAPSRLTNNDFKPLVVPSPKSCWPRFAGQNLCKASYWPGRREALIEKQVDSRQDLSPPPSPFSVVAFSPKCLTTTRLFHHPTTLPALLLCHVCQKVFRLNSADQDDPVARVKKIIATDEDLVQCSNSAAFTISVATVPKHVSLEVEVMTDQPTLGDLYQILD